MAMAINKQPLLGYSSIAKLLSNVTPTTASSLAACRKTTPEAHPFKEGTVFSQECRITLHVVVNAISFLPLLLGSRSRVIYWTIKTPINRFSNSAIGHKGCYQSLLFYYWGWHFGEGGWHFSGVAHL